MEDISHLKRGKFYRHVCSYQACYQLPLYKEEFCQNVIGWLDKKKESVVMLIELHPRISNTYKIISSEIVGWLQIFPSHLKELIEEKELEHRQET